MTRLETIASELLALRGALRLALTGSTVRADVLDALARSEAAVPSRLVRRAWAPEGTVHSSHLELSPDQAAHIARRVSVLTAQRELRARERAEKLAARRRSDEIAAEHEARRMEARA